MRQNELFVNGSIKADNTFVPCSYLVPPSRHISSDVHFWKHGQIGPTMIVTDECGAGHESAGEVVAVGEGVTRLQVGDRVAIEAGVPCSRADCSACSGGRYNACKSKSSANAVRANTVVANADELKPRPKTFSVTVGPNVVFFSTPPYHGTLTRYHVHPSEWVHKLPDNVSYEEGSLCEPLAVALAGIDRAGIRLGDGVVIA